LAVLRLIREWSAALPADWRPSAAEAKTLGQAVELIRTITPPAPSRTG
jgi:hypothetical protein